MKKKLPIILLGVILACVLVTKLYRMDLPHRAISVYIYLADRANKDGICWPSIPTISRDLKLSESTVRRALNDLRTVGAVKTRQRYRENGGYTSLLFALKDSR